jgi:hypothetical protein
MSMQQMMVLELIFGVIVVLLVAIVWATHAPGSDPLEH